MRIEITKEDFGIGHYFNDYAFRKAKKLTKSQINKFIALNEFIGYELDFLYRGRIRKATILAVSLPDTTITVYPTGEMNSVYNKEFAAIYSSYPYDFRVSIEGLEDFWTNKIDNLNIGTATKTSDRRYFQFNEMSDVSEYYMT